MLRCDGTRNEFGRNRTNVVKLRSALIHDGDTQVAYHTRSGARVSSEALRPN